MDWAGSFLLDPEEVYKARMGYAENRHAVKKARCVAGPEETDLVAGGEGARTDLED